MTPFTGKKETFFVLLAAIALSFLIYGNSIRGDFVFDDRVVVQERPDLKNLGNFFNLFVSPYHPINPQSSLFRPLTAVSYMLNYAVLGNSPAGFHVVNVILHGLCSFLAFMLVLKLSGSRRLAYFSAILFLTHPIHAEAVASIVGRAELLAFFFGLLAVLLFLKNRLFLSASSFFLAILSKEIAFGLLPAMFLIDWFWRSVRFKLVVKKMIWYLVPTGAYLLLRYFALGANIFSNTITNYVENPLKFLPWPERIAGAFKVLTLYLYKLVWPVKLSADYSYNAIGLVKNIFVSLPALLGLAALALLIFLSFYPKIRKSIIGLAAALFWGPFLIIGNILTPVGTIMAERLMYFSSLGFVIFPALLFVYLGERSVFLRKFSVFLVVIISLFFSVRTIVRNEDWLTNWSIFSASAKTSPKSAVSRYSLASLYLNEGKWAEAERELRIAQNIYYDYSYGLNLAGIIADHKKDFVSAEKFYKRSIQLNENAFHAYINLGNLFYKQKRYQEAAANYEKAAGINPYDNYPKFHYVASKLAANDYNSALDGIAGYYNWKIDNDVELTTVAGLAYYLKKDYPSAWKYLTRAKALGKNNPEIDEMINISKRQLNAK